MLRILPLIVLVFSFLPGCDSLVILLRTGSSTGETGSSELKRFSSQRELKEYFVSQITSRNQRLADSSIFVGPAQDGNGEVAILNGGGEAGALPSAGNTSGVAGSDGAPPNGSFSQTTTQVEGVDEADVVKTDGTHLFILDGNILRIVRVSPPDQLALLSEVSLEGSGRELFLRNNKVVALSQLGGNFFIAGGGGVAIAQVAQVGVAPEFRFERPRTVVTVIDVTTPDNPTLLSKTRFDGTPSASRMIDGVLHLVVANFQNFFFDVLPALGQPELNVQAVDVETLLPKFDRLDGDGSESNGDVVTFNELYRPTDPDGFGLVTVISLDVDADGAFTAVGIVAEPALVFSSLTALYLTDNQFDFFGDTRETTDIYKFDYVDRGAVPVATGTVPGRVLNQFSMDEHAGNLRVATTVGPTFSVLGVRSGPFNNVYVLGQSAGSLTILGRLENLAPGETIQSARFVGDRGFLVTFQQIDPLFTIDLSDPTHPSLVGTLKVPGFSTFIVPLDADHLLTVGQFIPDAAPFFPRGVQLSIFDVSDFADPQRTADVILSGNNGAASEALHNPKAFTYFAQGGLVALPVTILENIGIVDGVLPGRDLPLSLDETQTGGSPVDLQRSPDQADVSIAPSPPSGFEGLAVFRVSPQDGFTDLGRISTQTTPGLFTSSFTRGVFIGEDVFAVTNRAIRGAPVNDIESVPYELQFESGSSSGHLLPPGEN